jgi:hypothetical protein
MYNYQTERSEIFTESGQIAFLKIRDNVHKLLNQSGAVTMGKAISIATGNSWMLMACVDRLIELNEIREVTPNGVAGQHRVFVKIYTF